MKSILKTKNFHDNVILTVAFLLFLGILGIAVLVVQNHIQVRIAQVSIENYNRGVSDGVDLMAPKLKQSYGDGYTQGLTEGLMRAEDLCNVKFIK